MCAFLRSVRKCARICYLNKVYVVYLDGKSLIDSLAFFSVQTSSHVLKLHPQFLHLRSLCIVVSCFWVPLTAVSPPHTGHFITLSPKIGPQNGQSLLLVWYMQPLEHLHSKTTLFSVCHNDLAFQTIDDYLLPIFRELANGG